MLFGGWLVAGFVSNPSSPPTPPTHITHTIIPTPTPAPPQIFNPETGPGNRPRAVPMHTAFSNVLYLYPLALDRSQHRNLTVKVTS